MFIYLLFAVSQACFSSLLSVFRTLIVSYPSILSSISLLLISTLQFFAFLFPFPFPPSFALYQLVENKSWAIERTQRLAWITELKPEPWQSTSKGTRLKDSECAY